MNNHDLVIPHIPEIKTISPPSSTRGTEMTFLPANARAEPSSSLDISLFTFTVSPSFPIDRSADVIVARRFVLH